MGLFEKQREYLKALKSKEFLYLLYGGAVGGGKSILQIGILDQMCIDYPGIRCGIIRKNLTTLKRTSIPSYEKILEMNGTSNEVVINRSDYIAKYKNGSEILFVDADITKDPRLLKLSGTEFTILLLEECNELHEQAYHVSTTRVGRWKNSDYNIPPIIMLNCNPDKNWVKRIFYDPWALGNLKPPYYYLPALPKDNPYNTQEYLDALDRLPDSERQRLALGNWEYSENFNSLIHYEWIKDNFIELNFNETIKQKKFNNDIILGVDPARYGDDRSVLCFMFKNKIIKFESYKKVDTSELANIIIERINEYKIAHNCVAVDSIGLGGGVIDSLKEKKYNCIPYSSAESPDGKMSIYHKFKNRRAEAHWMLREDFRSCNIHTLNDIIFVEEATNISYEIKDGYIQIESKEAMKSRLGYSPDYLDSAVIANWLRRRNTVTNLNIDKVHVGESTIKKLFDD